MLTTKIPTFFRNLTLAVLLSSTFGSYTRPAQACSAPEAPAIQLSPDEIAHSSKRREEMINLGRQIFFDTRLSASGRMACSSCHSANKAYGPPDSKAVRHGGADMKQPGSRATPSLRYLQASAAFTEHSIGDEDFNLGEDTGPAGGHGWDGRVNSLREQAIIPLFAPHEMANGSPASFVSRMLKAPYASDFQRVFGPTIFDDADRATAQAALALEVFQESASEFFPYTSKYDEFLRGKAKLSHAEARGMALFNDANKGNCFTCHISQITANGGFPQFTDYGYSALGVPRNMKIAANRKPEYFDMGLCGPDRKDLAEHAEYCGQFKVPSLRNVATRRSFFHNGVFHSLRQVLEFYVDRDIHPERWYSRNSDGSARKYDDLPKALTGNVKHDAPFDRSPGQQARLSRSEIQDLIAFLNTLTDGYVPKQVVERSNLPLR